MVRFKKSRLQTLLIITSFLIIAVVLFNLWKIYWFHIVAFVAYNSGIQTDFSVYPGTDVVLYKEDDYRYIINNETACHSLPYLVVFVKSSPHNNNRRNAIRETWGNISQWKIKKNVLVLFMLGEVSELYSMSIKEENAVYRDIIQKNFKEAFNNLTIKLVSQLNWMSRFCGSANFFMTTDDDVFVNIQNLIDYLDASKTELLYAGCALFGSPPNRNKDCKYFVPETIYPGLFYPPYCSGAGYVLSIKALQIIFKQTQYVRMLYIDDSYFGILSNQLNLTPVHDSRFTCGRKFNSKSFITSHGYTPVQMKRLFKKLSF